MTEDRSIFVQPTQIVKTAWIDIDLCRLGCRERMDFAAIERAGRRLVQAGDCQIWPPIVGDWRGGRFVVCDGRHEYLALQALGRERIFVAWLEPQEKASAAPVMDYVRRDVACDIALRGVEGRGR